MFKKNQQSFESHYRFTFQDGKYPPPIWNESKGTSEISHVIKQTCTKNEAFCEYLTGQPFKILSSSLRNILNKIIHDYWSLRLFL